MRRHDAADCIVQQSSPPNFVAKGLLKHAALCSATLVELPACLDDAREYWAGQTARVTQPSLPFTLESVKLRLFGRNVAVLLCGDEGGGGDLSYGVVQQEGCGDDDDLAREAEPDDAGRPSPKSDLSEQDSDRDDGRHPSPSHPSHDRSSKDTTGVPAD
jgi:hypothetical protein